MNSFSGRAHIGQMVLEHTHVQVLIGMHFNEWNPLKASVFHALLLILFTPCPYAHMYIMLCIVSFGM